jgi:hypothetical protein
MFRAAYIHDSPKQLKILAVATNERDVRPLVQLSCFTLHDSLVPLEDVENSSAFLRKFTIPATAKHQLAQDLHLLGVLLPGLFPDLEHLSEYLSKLFFV